MECCQPEAWCLGAPRAQHSTNASTSTAGTCVVRLCSAAGLCLLAGDKLHVLHCIPQAQYDTFFAMPQALPHGYVGQVCATHRWWMWQDGTDACGWARMYSACLLMQHAHGLSTWPQPIYRHWHSQSAVPAASC